MSHVVGGKISKTAGTQRLVFIECIVYQRYFQTREPIHMKLEGCI